MKALIIGYGSIGKRHTENLLKKYNFEVIVVSSKTRKSQNKKIKFFESIEKSLKENPDFAIISNTTNEHVKVASILVNNGIDVFIEKPLSNSLKGIKYLLEKTKRNKNVTLMGCNLRFNPCIKKIKELLEKKSIGKIYSVQVENGSFLPDWHPNEDVSKSYVGKNGLGGGVILTCIHELDYLYWFFGDISEVFAISERKSRLDIETEDFAAILMKFKNNITASVHLDYFQKPNYRSCKIKGEKGIIEWNTDSNTVQIFEPKNNKWRKELKIKKYDKNYEYEQELDHFVSSVKSRKNTINDLSQGKYVLEVALGVKKSAKKNKIIKI